MTGVSAPCLFAAQHRGFLRQGAGCNACQSTCNGSYRYTQRGCCQMYLVRQSLGYLLHSKGRSVRYDAGCSECDWCTRLAAIFDTAKPPCCLLQTKGSCGGNGAILPADCYGDMTQTCIRLYHEHLFHIIQSISCRWWEPAGRNRQNAVHVISTKRHADLPGNTA